MTEPGDTILVVEDEVPMRRFLRSALTTHGFRVIEAGTLREAEALLTSTPPDAILLDLGLPDGDGLDLLRKLREWSKAPVIVLSARDRENDKVVALDAGADDYLTKPFAFEELLARLRALTRRTPVERPAVVEVGDLRLDPASHRVWRGEQELDLSAKEFSLLELFMRRPGLALTRTQLLDGAWDIAFESQSNVIDVYVRYLREKVDRPFGRDTIETVRGVGYRLRAD